MADKKQITLNLTDREMLILDQLANDRDLSKTQIIRQAVRLYQTVLDRTGRGEKLFFEVEQEHSKSELMVL